MTCVRFLPQAKLELKYSSIQQKYCLICCLKPPYLPMHETFFFVKTLKFLSATSNLRVKHNIPPDVTNYSKLDNTPTFKIIDFNF